MIINKEQIDINDSNGNLTKQLVISYVNKEGGISFLKWQIPQSELFEWGYTNRANADKPFYVFNPITKQPVIDEKTGQQKIAQWKSYDNKFVKKIPLQPGRNLSEGRLNEILNMFGKTIDPIFDATPPITWYCDIEVDVNGEGFPDAEHAAMPINTIAITRFPQTIVFARRNLTEKEKEYIQTNIDNYTDYTKGYKFDFRFYESEREMIEAFLDFITPIPCLTGWNFLGYDWKYIYNRCLYYGLNIERISPTQGLTDFKLNRKIKIAVKLPTHKVVYDYLQIYQMWDQYVKIKENDTLDWVSNKLLGFKKVEHEEGFEDFYKNHYADYVFYNAIDTILVEKIDEKIKTASIMYMLASELKIDLYAAFSTIQPCETVMTNFIYNQYRVVPRKLQKNEDDENGDYTGAFVWPTQPGIYKLIGGLDFASLYPTTMRQFYISPETFMFKDPTYIPKCDEIKTISGAVYKKRSDAIMPSILTYYFAKRKQAKKDRKTCDQTKEDLLKIYERRKAAGE